MRIIIRAVRDRAPYIDYLTERLPAAEWCFDQKRNAMDTFLRALDMAGKMGTADYFVRDLPFMFKDWAEYRDYLLDKLIDNPDWHASFRKEFDRQEAIYGDTEHGPEMRRNQINSILTNDWEHIKLANWERRPQIYNVRRAKQGKTSWQR